MPTRSSRGAAGARRRIRSISARSPTSDTRAWFVTGGLPGELNGPRLPDHCHLDLPGIFQLVLDPPGDILRQPDGFFVGNPVALDHDADFAAGLQRERLGHPFERIGDALEFLEPLDVRLENVAAGAWAGGGDRIRRLNEHRFE